MNAIRRTILNASRASHLVKRNFLSEAYKCQETWEQRLNASVLKKVNLDDMYQKLDQTLQNKGNVSVVDIDLFSNSVLDDNYADELEDLIHKFRLSRYTSEMLPSTPHAVVRAYLAMRKYDALIRILNDRLNYGIFPDYYCSNLMMDTLLKEKQYRDAAKVATFQMLQEDWGHPITSYLGLFACHTYLKTEKSEPWEVVTPENDEPEEEVKVRVMYIRNEFFDDHFDLRNPHHLIGKTFVTLSKALPVNDPVRRTYELVGWALYEKWGKAKSILQKLSSSSEEKEYILSEGVQLIEKVLVDGDQTKDEVKEFLKLANMLPNSKLQGESGLLDLMEVRLKKAVSEHEQKDIIEQINLYKCWEEIREKESQIQNELYQKELKMKKVSEIKKELTEKEDELFFFENKDKLDVMVEKNEVKKQEIIDKRKPKESDQDYIPPDVK